VPASGLERPATDQSPPAGLRHDEFLRLGGQHEHPQFWLELWVGRRKEAQPLSSRVSGEGRVSDRLAADDGFAGSAQDGPGHGKVAGG